jgi:CTP:molybdopterin cytidylyltransferase MocA
MGSPKALLPYRGETFVDRLIGVFDSAGVGAVVVLGHDAERIRAGIRRPATLVFNPDHALGQLTSLQCGLRAAADVDAALFTPVDYPSFKSETVRSLAAAWTGEDSAVVPVTQGKRGHPVLIGRRMIDEILALPADATAREVIHRHALRTKYIETDDAGILRDIDFPADFEALVSV